MMGFSFMDVACFPLDDGFSFGRWSWFYTWTMDFVLDDGSIYILIHGRWIFFTGFLDDGLYTRMDFYHMDGIYTIMDFYHMDGFYGRANISADVN